MDTTANFKHIITVIGAFLVLVSVSYEAWIHFFSRPNDLSGIDIKFHFLYNPKTVCEITNSQEVRSILFSKEYLRPSNLPPEYETLFDEKEKNQTYVNFNDDKNHRYRVNTIIEYDLNRKSIIDKLSTLIFEAWNSNCFIRKQNSDKVIPIADITGNRNSPLVKFDILSTKRKKDSLEEYSGERIIQTISLSYSIPLPADSRINNIKHIENNEIHLRTDIRDYNLLTDLIYVEIKFNFKHNGKTKKIIFADNNTISKQKLFTDYSILNANAAIDKQIHKNKCIWTMQDNKIHF